MTRPPTLADLTNSAHRRAPGAADARVRRVVLREHETTPGVYLSQAEVDALLASPARIEVRPMSGATGHYSLRPGSRVGLLAVGDLALEIRPKVSVDRLLFLLAYGLQHARWPLAPISGRRDDDLTEALVMLYGRLLRGALARGVLQGYRTEEDALPGVRGRIRFDDQLRTRFGLAPPVEVRFDDYTEDIEANRVLKAALYALARVARRSSESRRTLRALGQPLQRVTLVEYPPNRVPAIPIDRLNEHYAPALRLAELILRCASLDLRHGDLASSSVLFDMNRVFESFVRRALREALGLDPRSFPAPGAAPPLWMDVDEQVRLLPDLSWWEGARCRFVGDAKYKRLGRADFVHGDLYQMLAYLTATGLPEGLLVYAEGEGAAARHEMRRAGKVIHVRTLELAGDEERLMAQVRELAAVVRRVAE